jgi:hypothetical protein
MEYRDDDESVPPNEKIQDMGLIDSRVQGMANQIYQQHDQYQEINELVEEAFTRGIKEVLSTRQKPEKVREDFLIEDEFKYRAWQLNLHTDNMEADWAEIKSDILFQGLKKISHKLNS